MKTILSSPSSQRRARSGSALVITLLFLTIVSLILVVFVDATRVERAAAGTHLDRMQAGALAQRGVDQIVSILQRETASPSRNWITQPGALIVPQATGTDQRRLRYQVKLSTGAPSGAALGRALSEPEFRPPNLNMQVLSDQSADPTYLISDQPESGASSGAGAAKMLLRWAYVRRDGSIPTVPDPENSTFELPDDSPTIDPGNPIIGRFAYWADDESTKINYNIAWKRKSTNADLSNVTHDAHPSRINLMALQLPNEQPLREQLADALHYFTNEGAGRARYFANAGTPRPFNSFADARQLWRYLNADTGTTASELRETLDYNKFNLTHFNHDPDTTFFNEDRIVLTTRRELVPKLKDGKPARQFLDILVDTDENGNLPGTSEPPDPGLLDHIAGGQPNWSEDPKGNKRNKNKLHAVVKNLIEFISTNDWPLSPTGGSGSSFLNKYYPGSTKTEARLGQIAVNIIDYVRAKESKQIYVPPMRFGVDKKGEYTMDPEVTYGQPNSFQGVSRSPYITEMGMWMENEPYTPVPRPEGWPTVKGEGGKDVLDAQGKPITQPLYKCYFKTEVYWPEEYAKASMKDEENDFVFDFVPDGTAESDKGWFVYWWETRDPEPTADDPAKRKADQVSYYTFAKRNSRWQRVNQNDTATVRIYPEEVSGFKKLSEPDTKPPTWLKRGSYVTITKVFYRDKSRAERPRVKFRSAIYEGLEETKDSKKMGLLLTPLNRWPRVNIATQEGEIDLYPLPDPTMVPINQMPSIQVDDPRCNVNKSDWQYVSVNDFGSRNQISTLGKTPTASPIGKPQQDTDANGKVSGHSFYMPDRWGTGKNGVDGDDGRVTSVGELGWVLTGNDTKNTSKSVPWRSIRLQPNNYPNNTVLPDWAFLDLFSVPTKTFRQKEQESSLGPQFLFAPHGTSVAGRVNVNSHVSPFNSMVRNRALVALLLDAPRDHSDSPPTMNRNDAEIIGTNIYERKLATSTSNKGKTYGYPWTTPGSTSAPNAYDTVGEICEIAGVAEGGEESEDMLRRILSLGTSRGSVFSVYSIGQAIRQTAAGRLEVLSEQRQHAIVERVLDNRGTSGGSEMRADDVVSFRTIYSRNLSL